MISGSLPIYTDLSTYRQACDRARAQEKRVGLVPTMGALHDGHFALIDEARRHADFVVVSIFVNPTQFGPSEDLDKYPRTWESDVEGCISHGASCVFHPSVPTMYPAGEQTRVRVGAIAEPLCGAFRAGHFEGVATIVTKLFAATGPCVAVFGRKDYQQIKVIERLTTDLLLPVTIVGHPTVREADGLAMSSRNRYLNEEQRQRAAAIPHGLNRAVRAYERGERKVASLRHEVVSCVAPVADSIDYVEIADADTLEPMDEQRHIAHRALIALAIRVGPARLIDNIVLGEDPPIKGQAE
ncbi:MAG TPA: pantoate--beta-alanine ligase [Polyangiaceae bacterium]|nr:pantoate--beta-alanine ligase [Polyangiaceae bacterium]